MAKVKGELAGAVALVRHGNAFLTDSVCDDFAKWNDHSAFRYVQAMRFVYREYLWGIVPHGSLLATSPCDWFAALKQRGVTSLRLTIVRRNGWMIRSMTGHDPTSFWRSKLRYVGDRKDNRIWKLIYCGTAVDKIDAHAELDLKSATNNLRSALDAAAEFARSRKLPDWEQRFVEARSTLDQTSPTIPYHPDLLGGATSPDIQRLAAASVRAWVFGGMGSWDDVGINEPRSTEYRDVTSELYRSVLDGIAATANDSAT